MIDRLHDQMDALTTKLAELGAYQLHRQQDVQAQLKSDASFKEAWRANDVVSEVDLHTEKELLAFLKQAFGDIPVISEEFNNKAPPAPGEFRFVVDPLDGTKPYLEGKREFSISIGLMQGREFVFGGNFYAGLDQFYWAFADSEGVMDRDGKPLTPAREWLPECYLSVSFYDLLSPEHRSPEAIHEALGVGVVDYPRSATYILKRILEGQTFAYMSKDVYIWDIGPSSLLLDKMGCHVVDLKGVGVDFGSIAQPPFRHPAAVALPKGREEAFLSRLQRICASGNG
ncbi:MAG: inositol monophosphatase family protein [Magnetococcales bacterium]|nr:inositol monophosphatase family protein [Magnetococcales bacterium]